MLSVKYICGHPEMAAPKRPPCEVDGCCERMYSCPVCGFGKGESPHECKGWQEEQPEPAFGTHLKEALEVVRKMVKPVPTDRLQDFIDEYRGRK